MKALQKAMEFLGLDPSAPMTPDTEERVKKLAATFSGDCAGARRKSDGAGPAKMSSLLPSLGEIKPIPVEDRINEAKAWFVHSNSREWEGKIRNNVEAPELFAHTHAGFGSIEWIAKKNPKAVAACKAFAANFRDATPPLLVGPSGCGKSHLLWATAIEIERLHNDWCEKQREAREAEGLAQIDSTGGKRPELEPPPTVSPPEVLVIPGCEIAHDLRQSIENHNLDKIVEKYRQSAAKRCSPVLFIDDLEVMKLNEWTLEELYRIIDYRYSHKLPTFVASNLMPGELRKHLGDRIARRIIKDMTITVEMK